MSDDRKKSRVMKIIMQWVSILIDWSLTCWYQIWTWMMLPTISTSSMSVFVKIESLDIFCKQLAVNDINHMLHWCLMTHMSKSDMNDNSLSYLWPISIWQRTSIESIKEWRSSVLHQGMMIGKRFQNISIFFLFLLSYDMSHGWAGWCVYQDMNETVHICHYWYNNSSANRYIYLRSFTLAL